MKLLLDTQTFLWFIDDSPQLSQQGKALLETDNVLLLSIASLWEIAIKRRLGKLTVAMPTQVLMTEQLTRNDIDVLPITVPRQMLCLYQIPSLTSGCRRTGGTACRLYVIGSGQSQGQFPRPPLNCQALD